VGERSTPTRNDADVEAGVEAAASLQARDGHPCVHVAES
jgi:hypothetical protein